MTGPSFCCHGVLIVIDVCNARSRKIDQVRWDTRAGHGTLSRGWITPCGPTEKWAVSGERGKSMSRLLVVDDEERVRKLLQRVLQSEGYSVDLAGTGTQGLSAATDRKYDLIVLDLMLPDRSGTEVLIELLVRQPNSRVVVLSAVPEIGTPVHVLTAGPRDFRR